MSTGSSTPTTQTPAFVTPVTSRPGTPGASIAAPPPTISVDKNQDEQSRFKTFLSLLKKFVGVADIANVRFSLPATLMEPIPNLEYWQYLDRPEAFVSIGTSDNDLGRMLEVLRFWFTKDLKYVKGKPCKPYNSVLGEFFRCNWFIKEDAPPINVPSKAPSQPPNNHSQNTGQPVTLSYMTEQTSHHPPISAYWAECPERGIIARGYDQLSAKFSGTYIRVVPGNYNLGIFITLTNRGDEEYRLTHVAANLAGILRGNFYISVSDTCYVTCPKTKLKAILTYEPESWLGKTQNKVNGVIFRYDPQNDRYTKIKDVPDKEVLAKIDGCWQDQIYFSIPGTKAVSHEPNVEPQKDKQLLIDVSSLWPEPKIYPPEENQLPNESRRFWRDLTSAIVEKRWNDASNKKLELEQGQRDKAAERKKLGVEWQPRFFTNPTEPDGRPIMTQEGRALIDGMNHRQYFLEESKVYGA